RRAFETLLRETASEKKWELVTEESIRREGSNSIRYDGTLRDVNRLPHGWWEAKDTSDNLDAEIKKKREKGYRFDNIIFEDTRQAVLFQNNQEVVRADVRQPDKLADLLSRFYSHEIEPFTKFVQAVAYFQNEIPHIAGGIKAKIEAAHKGNKQFQTAFETFMELCRVSLNPNIAPAAVDEMLIQHMLTERLIRKVFDVEEFSRRNVIASEVENVIDALTSQNFNRTEFLGALDRFYTAIEEAADRLATFSEKQDFINHVYERFFQGYSVKVADTHGIVYTPQPIVDFMCAAVEEVLQTEFGKKLGDEGVYVLDPATGTGNFIVNLLRRCSPRTLDNFYRHHLFANEVMLMPYYIASLNIEHEYYALTGKYETFEGVCFVDTLDMAESAQMKLSFMTEKNSARVERQKAAPITVIIGNPPYNSGQLNENDNNKNRKYEVIDKRVAETYAQDSKATNKNALSDPYVKFFRWATDRLQGRDGIVCYVSNNGFVNGIAFDGFRKNLLKDFNQIYHLDLRGNARTSGERRREEGGNVFDDKIRVGVGITIAIQSSKQVTHKIYYHSAPPYWRKENKLAYLIENVNLDGKQNSLNTVEWQELMPDGHHTWLVPENADEFSAFLPTGGKETKSSKGIDVEAIFKNYSSGVKTNRDEVVLDFDRSTLTKRVQQFIEDYNAEVDRYNRAGKPKNIDDFIRYDTIKWSESLKSNLVRGNYATFDPAEIRVSMYRPFMKQWLYFNSFLIERRYQFHHISPTRDSELENKIICVSGPGHEIFRLAISNHIVELKYANPSNGGSQCFPFYVYDPDGTNRRENITDWALAQFRAHYGTLTPQPPLPQVEGEQEAGLEVPRPEGEGFRVRVDDAVLRAKASEAMTQIARDLRQRQTPAESILWETLRDRRLDNMKFRRQHAIENTAYVADFLCYEARLVIEVDGGIHEHQIENDAIRQANIEAQGYDVVRFSNAQILNDLENVLTTIVRTARMKAPRPEGEGFGVRVEREISKWDIFYYVYGLLHHPDYRERYADNLKRELPRIPFVPAFSPRPEGEGPGVRVFQAFCEAGKKLAELHLHYETVKPFELEWVTKNPVSYRVEKMRPIFSPRPEGEGSGVRVYNAIQVNDTLTLKGIPAEAFEYRLGNRSALDWVIDQYQ
ncbi:MAG: type ISP restriction/modification enzyme, partial [Chloroflexota bacterium]